MIFLSVTISDSNKFNEINLKTNYCILLQTDFQRKRKESNSEKYWGKRWNIISENLLKSPIVLWGWRKVEMKTISWVRRNRDIIVFTRLNALYATMDIFWKLLTSNFYQRKKNIKWKPTIMKRNWIPLMMIVYNNIKLLISINMQ